MNGLNSSYSIFKSEHLKQILLQWLKHNLPMAHVEDIKIDTHSIQLTNLTLTILMITNKHIDMLYIYIYIMYYYFCTKISYTADFAAIFSRAGKYAYY